MLSTQATEILAITVLAVPALVVTVWAVVWICRLPYTPFQAGLFGLNYLLVRILWRTQINGRLPIAPGQGAVIVSNHRSPIDPGFLQIIAGRTVHWMVAREYCEMPIVARFLRTLKVIPTGRTGVDTAATKAAIRYAAEGGVVGLFPEGRINTTEQLLLPGRPGAAMIALKARVPVVPCYIEGSPHDGTFWGWLFMAAKARLEIGQPLDLSDYYGREDDRDVLEMLTRRFLVEIARLAGRTDFRPQMAGRFYASRD